MEKEYIIDMDGIDKAMDKLHEDLIALLNRIVDAVDGDKDGR